MKWITMLFTFLIMLFPPLSSAIVLKNKLDTEIKLILEYKQKNSAGQTSQYICNNITTLYGYNQIKYPLQTLCGYSTDNPVKFYLAQAVMVNGGAIVDCKFNNALNDNATVVIEAQSGAAAYQCIVK